MKAPLFIKKFSTNSEHALQHLLRSKLHFAILPLIFALLKIFSAFWLLERLNEGNFISLFHGWDSYYYLSIASNWYPSKVVEIWAFFPFYPLCSRIVNLALHNLQLSMVSISFFAGVMWLPFYQSIAERYMNVDEAFTSTCIFASFPQVFLFTSVAYNESLFLFATLTAWLLYLRKKIFFACVLACLATLTKPYGILIVLPIFLGMLSRNRWNRIPFVLLPIVTILGWIWYNFIKTGDYFAFITAQEHWAGMPWQPINWFQGFLLPQLGIQPEIQATTPITPFSVYILLAPFVMIIACLIIMCFKYDWKLGIYGMAMLTTILSFGTPLSMPRFLPFIFPVWLNIKTRNFLITLVICAIFYIHSLAIWLLFSNNVWIG
jgi:Gpi18-like mannosyltransferase